MKRFLFLALLTVAMPAGAVQTVSFSKSQIAPGQSVELIFSSDEAIRQEPDLSALKNDFMISGRQVQQLSSMVNGRVSQSYQLIYNVYPKRSGQFEVQGLTLNGQILDPVRLTVTPTASAQMEPIVTLQQEVSAGPYYTGSGIIYQVKLSDIARIHDGGINPPVLANAKVEQIGSDVVKTVRQENKSIQELRRTYLITPQSSGLLRLEPASFVGVRLTSQTPRRSAGELFEMGLLFDGLMGGTHEDVFATAEPIDITVLQKPADWQGWWLPSKAVTLTESYRVPDEIKVGEAIERTLTLSAADVVAEALPVPSQDNTPLLKGYAGHETRDTVLTDTGVEGRLSITQVLVPLGGGEITVPAVSVPWFNTQTGKREIARVPARTFKVSGVAAADTAVSAAEPKTVVSSLPEQGDALPIRQADVIRHSVMTAADMWIWLGIGIVSGALIVGLVVLILHKMNKQKRQKPLPDLYPFK